LGFPGAGASTTLAGCDKTEMRFRHGIPYEQSASWKPQVRQTAEAPVPAKHARALILSDPVPPYMGE
jgi:hypothetical protein